MSTVPNRLASPVVSLINKIDQVCQTDYRARIISWKTGFHSASYRFPKDQLAFIHIPKTGGTSISAMLEKIDTNNQLAIMHTHRPVSRHCPPGEYQYITMLRDPVSRVFSYYKMAERNERDNPYSHLCGRGLEHFLIHCWETRNMSCRYIAGDTKREANEALFQKACTNLLNFRFVGLFEEFDDSVRRLLDLLGLGDVEIPHHRKSPASLPSPEQRALIEKYNEYDLRLYDFYLQHSRQQ